MENIVKSFLEKEMLLSPHVLESLKEKNDISLYLKSVSYSLVLNSLDVKPNEPVKQELSKPVSNTVFQKFVQENKNEIKPEENITKEVNLEQKSAILQQKIENTTLEVKQETKLETKTEIKVSSYKHDIKPIKVFEKTDSKHSIEDFIKSSNERYEFLRKILSEKAELQNLTSINKINESAEVSIIGMVKSVDKKERPILEVEDSTGSVKLLLENDNHRFLIGDVIGVSGMMKKEYFIPKRVMFPDIPIKRSIVTSQNESFAMFCGKFSDDKVDKISKIVSENKINYLFVTGKKDDIEKLSILPPECKIVFSPIYLFSEGNEPFIGPKFSSDSILSVSSPSLLSIEGIGLLIYNGSSYEKLPRNDEGILEIVKRRYIPLKLSANNFLLDSIPDVVYSSLDKTSLRNHKGSTLISVDDDNAVILNLKTRETKIIPLV